MTISTRTSTFAFIAVCRLLTDLGNAGDCLAEDNVNKPRLKVAAVVTVYRPNAHADVIVGRLLQGYHLNGEGPHASLELVSLYVDQKPQRDLSRTLADKHGFRLCESVEEALTLGSGKLAVEGVLLVAEHGSYPKSETDQVLYPKRRLFTGIVEVFRKSGRVVPVFSDKHLSDNWMDAKWIYDTAREMNIPLMAGSSLPSYRRLPPANVQKEAELEEVVAVGYGGSESYGFHALEMLQCLAERRKGGETGVKSVQFVEGDAVWAAAKNGVYDPALLEAALKRSPSRKKKRPLEEAVRKPVMYSIRYHDGLKASVLMLNGATGDFTVAWKSRETTSQKSTIESTLFAIEQDRPYMHFTDLLLGIEKMMHSGKATWPAERTLLTTGMLNAAMLSHKQSGTRIETPYLKIRYRSDWNWRQPLPQEQRFR